MNSRKKLPEKTEKLDIKFCLECGDELDEFSLSKKAKNIKKVRDRHKKCKETGKFNGEMCSKVFMANQDDAIWSAEED